MRIACSILVVICLTLAGCHGDDEHSDDDCAICHGTQTATPDGKCPTCGAPVEHGGRH